MDVFPSSLSPHSARAVTDACVLSTMYHLSRNGANFQMFAPNQQQAMVMDHVKRQSATGDNRQILLLFFFYTHQRMNLLTLVVFIILFGLSHRNMMAEAGRFSHGQGATQMQDLSNLDVNNFDGIIFPGGHGIIKNL